MNNCYGKVDRQREKEEESMNNLASDSEAPTPPVPLAELILSLEQATLMAKQLPTATHPSHLLQIYSSLHQAHHHLSSFISQTHFPLSNHPPPHAVAENSLSSATGAGMAVAGEDGDEPMQVGDDDYEAGAEENSKATIDKVEEKMRDCFIKNKRAKRPLSPSSVAEERRLVGEADSVGIKNFDPHGTRLRALNIVYQFHG